MRYLGACAGFVDSKHVYVSNVVFNTSAIYCYEEACGSAVA